MSASKELLKEMELAATGALWHCIASRDVPDSLRQAFLHRCGLAIVDLTVADQMRRLEDVFRLTRDSGGLAIAYDPRANEEAELWARQQGAWLYLPGEADWAKLTSACEEAGVIYQQLKANGTAAALG